MISSGGRGTKEYDYIGYHYYYIIYLKYICKGFWVRFVPFPYIT
jgi:hypothetical protein